MSLVRLGRTEPVTNRHKTCPFQSKIDNRLIYYVIFSLLVQIHNSLTRLFGFTKAVFSTTTISQKNTF